MERQWWKEAVVYQIYPRSFCDSNGDGIGDLPGILSKLDYIRSLGVDVIWLCPVYRSPNADNGYDISDYRDIMEEFGTLADFDALLAGAHARGLKIIMDLVVNHTSDEHAWFIESRASKENPKRDYYIWRKGKHGGEPNDWASFFTPSAWQYDAATDEYYLHLFSEKQPDLNWENPAVRGEVYSLMSWWLERGVDGFRMDVISCISKVPGLPSVVEGEPGYRWAGRYFLNGPCVHQYLREMNREVLSHYDCMTVGEAPGAGIEDALRYTDGERSELQMLFLTDLMGVDDGSGGKFDPIPYEPERLKLLVAQYQHGFAEKGWNSLFLGNHDNPRIVSRFGDDGRFRAESGKMLATLLLTLRGTPYLYQGDEIGMTNLPRCGIDGYRDIETLNFYREAKENGADEQQLLDILHRKSRDHARTPMQWNTQKNAGFSSGTPWIDVNPNYDNVNAAAAEVDPNSILRYYRAAIALRRATPALVYGSFEELPQREGAAFAYLRILDGSRVLVALNLTGGQIALELPENFTRGRLLLGNYLRADLPRLRPYEASVWAL